MARSLDTRLVPTRVRDLRALRLTCRCSSCQAGRGEEPVAVEITDLENGGSETTILTHREVVALWRSGSGHSVN